MGVWDRNVATRASVGHAIDLGLDAAIPGVIELGPKVGEFGRGERI